VHQGFIVIKTELGEEVAQWRDSFIVSQAARVVATDIYEASPQQD